MSAAAKAALDQAVAAASPVVKSTSLVAPLYGIGSNARIVAYQIPAREWEALVSAVRAAGDPE